jgi:hypothetical protein
MKSGFTRSLADGMALLSVLAIGLQIARFSLDIHALSSEALGTTALHALFQSIPTHLLACLLASFLYYLQTRPVGCLWTA